MITQGSGTAHCLTRSPDADLAPSWSPTGRTLVYVNGNAGHRDLLPAHRQRRSPAPPDGHAGRRERPPASRLRRQPRDVRYFFMTYGKRSGVLHEGRGGSGEAAAASRNVRARRITNSSSASSFPSWQAAGLPPVIAAAGDAACSPNDPSFNNGQGQGSFLPPDAELGPHAARRPDQRPGHRGPPVRERRVRELPGRLPSTQPGAGSSRSSKAVAGNHEYETPAPAGTSAWTSTARACSRARQATATRVTKASTSAPGTSPRRSTRSATTHRRAATPTSPQIQWLKSDLAAHLATCTSPTGTGPRTARAASHDGGT